MRSDKVGTLSVPNSPVADVGKVGRSIDRRRRSDYGPGDTSARHPAGAGFIGSFLVDRLLAEGYRVRVLDRLDPQVHASGAPAYLNPAADLVVGDVRDRTLLAQRWTAAKW